jgi:putative N-acetyltransferase (TIGR04045 family)
MARTAATSRSSAPAEAAGTEAGRRAITCRVATDPHELATHHEIRHRVFVEEQGIFEHSDRDEHDDDPNVVHVLALFGSVAGGAVRLYPVTEDGDWKGDRLAVLAAYRRHGLGAPLVRFAVRTARQRGGRRMIAHIQPSNVRFFERLGWERVGEPIDYVGLPHQQMEIDLTRVP